jgi:hypothetical protein
MRRVVLRSLVLSSVVLGLAIPAAPVSAGPPIDLPKLDILYEYDPPLNSHGYWVGQSRGGEWRVVDGRLGPAGRLTLDLEVRPPAISVPLEPGPAVLFGRLALGDAGGDMHAGASVPGTVERVLQACPDLGYTGCNGTEKAGPARIHVTDQAMLIAIPMRSILPGDACAGLGPIPMTVRLPEPLAQRTLYDAGSLPIRGANAKLDR